MRECKTIYGTKMGNGRRVEQTFQGNSGYARRSSKYSNDFKKSRHWGSFDGEDQEHQSKFA